MIFYASGAIVDRTTLELVVRHRIAILTSFAYKNAFRKQMPILAPMLRECGWKMPYMLDSGAFTAWNKGKNVRMEVLIDFYNQAVDEYGDCLDLTCISLDRIPGRQGVERTPQDFLDAAKETVENYEYMVKKVRAPLKPVYHDGEPRWVLDAYEGAKYVGLSANQDQSYAYREAWVKKVEPWFPGKQLHGLAMTGTRMLRTIRWYSVDSAAWVLWAAMGAIALLRDDGSLKIMACSKESPQRKNRDKHITTLPVVVQERLRAELAEEGMTFESIAEEGLARSRWNILVFHKACEWAASNDVVAARLVQGMTHGLFD